MIGAALVTGVGLLGDRVGRRPVLLAVAVLAVAGSAALVVSGSLAVVIVASGLGGVGRGGGAGSGGAFGPFMPAEQPLLAASVSPGERTRAFGRMSFLGGAASAAGSLVAGVPALLHGAGLDWIAAYRVLFAAAAVVSLGVAAACIPLRDPPRRPAPAAPATPATPATSAGGSAATSPGAGAPASAPAGAPASAPSGAPANGPAGMSTRRLIGLLGLTNALNGFGFGFIGPLLTYWLHVRYGVGPAAVGTLYTAINLVSAVPYLGAHRLAARLGAVRTVVVARAASLAILLSMAAAPTFVVAGVLLCARIAFNSLSVPARLSFAMGAADEQRRGAVAALTTLPSAVTSSISPVIGGSLMGLDIDAPIYGAVLFMGINVFVYYFAFRHAELPEEAAGRRAATRGATTGWRRRGAVAGAPETAHVARDVPQGP